MIRYCAICYGALPADAADSRIYHVGECARAAQYEQRKQDRLHPRQKMKASMSRLGADYVALKLAGKIVLPPDSRIITFS